VGDEPGRGVGHAGDEGRVTTPPHPPIVVLHDGSNKNRSVNLSFRHPFNTQAKAPTENIWGLLVSLSAPEIRFLTDTLTIII
jgi:hypothetical protein